MEEASIESVKSAYDGVCRQLNMDTESRDEAWATYCSIRDYYTLEVRYKWPVVISIIIATHGDV